MLQTELTAVLYMLLCTPKALFIADNTIFDFFDPQSRWNANCLKTLLLYVCKPDFAKLTVDLGPQWESEE